MQTAALPSLPPTIIAAARTEALRGSYLAVYVELHHWLDASEFRTVKAWRVASELHMHPAHIYRALRLLSELGFLECGGRFGNAYTYRLVSELPPARGVAPSRIRTGENTAARTRSRARVACSREQQCDRARDASLILDAPPTGRRDAGAQCWRDASDPTLRRDAAEP